jgi:hypothetical protein
MGRLRAFARKLVEAAQSLHDEAGHPGVPPPHKRQENTFHKDVEVVAPEAAKGRTDRPWYQQADTDGWDETDPKK